MVSDCLGYAVFDGIFGGDVAGDGEEVWGGSKSGDVAEIVSCDFASMVYVERLADELSLELPGMDQA